MGLALCKQHLPDNGKTDIPYTGYVVPMGYPKSALVCSRGGCDDPAVLWLKSVDLVRFRIGERLFFLGQQKSKVLVCDDPITLL